ncbi:hypothetical protein B0T26DRAFT_691471 [Lasiosphaeria miniovina]|uniref:Uncharacterized protein n=1 Tax=Lasiosphaeria miniovina TaxID=1954250 RepID=A0AA40E8V8_9PEZI|nr:uncharacterized protein B0T26DRAFT_691471 [Lasiosphaeria miniovina]KAK0726708.1 hypothetical protein B0T26DRAFT_691471 [Lasiosphaeria miniovina]
MLIVIIPTEFHEGLHLGLYNLGRDSIIRIGRGDNWRSMGTAKYRAQGHPNGDEGEGDSTGGPEPQRQHLGAWPTLVIKAGYSQSLEALRGDMSWWFGASDHQVKIVLLAKFDTQQMTAIIEKWIITITQNPGTNRDNPTSYTVTRGALRLEFDLLFLQQPQPGSAEGDVIIDIPDLQRWAVRLWRLVP